MGLTKAIAPAEIGGSPLSTTYETDFYAWANEQAALLRAGKLAEADIEHIAGEIESMGKAEKRELVNRLTVLLLHLLKWRFQPKWRGSSWETRIKIQRIQTREHMEDNPSLKANLTEYLSSAYRVARLEAADETKLAETTFPPNCPWIFEQAMDPEFWPDGAA